MSRQLRIDINRDLPRRPRGLTADALSKVFGGCASTGWCDFRDPNSCCPSIGCNRQSNGTYRCSYSAAY